MSAKNTTGNIGGIPYILPFLHIYLPYSIVSTLAFIFGLVGNLCVILAILIDKKRRRNQTCILIVSLALSDLLISVLVQPSIIAGVFMGKTFFDDNIYLCKFLSSICVVCCIASIVTMGFLALNRYIFIFYLNLYKTHFTIKKTLIMSLIAWIIGFLANVPNFFGIGDHVYDLKVLSCHFDRLQAAFTIFISVICGVIPCTCISFLYLRIFCHSFHTHNKLVKKNMLIKCRHKLKSMNIAKSLFATFLLFLICWLPLTIVLLCGTNDNLPIWLHTTVNSAAHFNSCLNPILYLIFNPIVRDGYKDLARAITFNRIFFRMSINNSKNAFGQK